MPRNTGGGEGRRLPRDHESLAFGVGPDGPRARLLAPGAISVLAVRGGYEVGPCENRTVLFGRNRDEVHVCVGGDDRGISRQQGVFTHRQGTWWLHNTGKLPIRLPRSQWLFPDDEEFPLAAGYTPLFMRGSGTREHLLEAYVVGPLGEQRPAPSIHTALTDEQRGWRLDPVERLVVTALGQRYLRHEARPHPMSRQQVAELLAEIQPDEQWDHRKVERVVAGVRMRLADAGIAGLTKQEVPEPIGNALNHNLLTELVMNTTTLTPPDLALLDDPAEDIEY